MDGSPFSRHARQHPLQASTAPTTMARPTGASASLPNGPNSPTQPPSKRALKLRRSRAHKRNVRDAAGPPLPQITGPKWQKNRKVRAARKALRQKFIDRQVQSLEHIRVPTADPIFDPLRPRQKRREPLPDIEELRARLELIGLLSRRRPTVHQTRKSDSSEERSSGESTSYNDTDEADEPVQLDLRARQELGGLLSLHQPTVNGKRKREPTPDLAAHKRAKHSLTGRQSFTESLITHPASDEMPVQVQSPANKTEVRTLSDWRDTLILAFRRHRDPAFSAQKVFPASVTGPSHTKCLLEEILSLDTMDRNTGAPMVAPLRRTSPRPQSEHGSNHLPGLPPLPSPAQPVNRSKPEVKPHLTSPPPRKLRLDLQSLSDNSYFRRILTSGDWMHRQFEKCPDRDHEKFREFRVMLREIERVHRAFLRDGYRGDLLFDDSEWIRYKQIEEAVQKGRDKYTFTREKVNTPPAGKKSLLHDVEDEDSDQAAVTRKPLKSNFRPLKKSMHHRAGSDDSDEPPTNRQGKKPSFQPPRLLPDNAYMRHFVDSDSQEGDETPTVTHETRVEARTKATGTVSSTKRHFQTDSNNDDGLRSSYQRESSLSDSADLFVSSDEPEPIDDSNYHDEPESHNGSE